MQILVISFACVALIFAIAAIIQTAVDKFKNRK